MTLYRLIWWSDITGAMSLDLPFADGGEAFRFITRIPGANLNKKIGAFPIGPATPKWENGKPLLTRNGFTRRSDAAFKS